MESRHVTVNITNRTVVRTIILIALALGIYRFLGEVTHTLTLIFASFFLALALNPVVSWMSRRLQLKSRIKATAAAYLTVVFVLGLFLALIIPPLVSQTRDFIKEVPATVENFQEQKSGLADTVRRYNLDERLSLAAKDFTSEYSNFTGTVLNTGKRIAGTVVSIIVVLVLTFMMLVEGPRWLELFWGVSSPKQRAHRQQLAYKMYRAVSGFVNGQVILAVLAGTTALVALIIASTLLNVSINVVALAGIVAILALIPMFGNILSAIIVVLVCALSSVNLAIIMLIYFIVYQQIENVTFQPFIQSKVSQLSPLTVFVAALLGVGFSGLLGAIVAIPAASAIKILVEDHFARRHGYQPPTKAETA